ncbi:DNRLRE domain-containing protein [candidate division WOR-3 bacterium]|nr:DNRLRE domain-containing protein [candidate division WOR-3 bacterium]
MNNETLKIIASISLICVIILLGGCTKAKTITLQPDPDEGKDAYIWSAEPDLDYADSDSLLVGEYEAGTNFELYSLIEFTGLSEYEGVELENATLELYCNNTNLSTVSISICRLNEAWNEQTLRWKSYPDLNKEIVITESWPTPDSWWSVDVTRIVRTWLDGSATNYGFCLYCDTTKTEAEEDWTSFYSSDYEIDKALHPKLTLEYEK